MAISLTKEDFYGLGKVAKHCNQEKLTVAINEAIEFDLKPLLCDLFYVVEDNWDEVSGSYKDLVSGATFENCRGVNVSHSGLKKVLIYFAYARYVIINNFDDTANGGVTKTDTWSMPKPLKELQAYSNKYESMALEIWRGVNAFICKKGVEVYENFDYSDCSTACGCGGKCSERKSTKGFGIRGSLITKNIT